jgi:phospholipase/carboxylesterase
MVAWVSARWRVKRSSILLTGLSDGGTFALLTGLGEASPFTALAPIAGVLHPSNAINGNLVRAVGKRIYLVHGARDWMFPVETAQRASDRLREAGAHIVYREIADLSHTYPREENGRILEWLDPVLAVPGQTEEA